MKKPRFKVRAYVEKIRAWDSPKTATWVTADEIGSRMPYEEFIQSLKSQINLDQFIATLTKEIGSVAVTFTKEAFTKQVQEAYMRSLGAFEKDVEDAAAKVLEAL